MKPESMQTELAKHGIEAKPIKQAFTISSEQIKANCISFISGINPDGRLKVTISGSATKSARQRGLQWVWYKDVVNSGFGGRHEEDENSLDLFAKWMWVRPILIREDSMFSEIIGYFLDNHAYDPDSIKLFTRDWIHTEKLTVSQMAEFLTSFQQYYLSRGVNLSEPEDRKLLEFEKRFAA